MTLKLNGTNSEAAPAYAGDDADTGLQCGTNELKLVTGGTARATVDSSGRFGIGISTLSNVLHVHQTDATANSYVHITQADGGSGATDGLSVGIEDGGVNAVIRNRENGYLRMYTNNTERMRILADGGLTFNGDTAQANALDDYEEGDWTPACSQFAAITSSGKYTKIGRIVYIEGLISRNTSTSPSATNVEVTGLPFTVSNIASTVTGNYWLDEGGPNTNLGDSVGAAYFTGTRVLFVKPTDPSQKTDTRYVQANDLTNNRGISFFGWYRV